MPGGGLQHTDYTSLNSTDSWFSNADKRKTNINIFLAKASTTEDQKILLAKLYKYGIGGILHQWFLSYLTDGDTIMSNQ